MSETTRLLSDDNDVTFKGNIQRNGTVSVPITQCKAYRRRWYILALSSLVILTQPTIWSTWSAIQDTAQVVFQWSNADLALMLLWGPICFFAMAIPSFWMLDNKSLRLNFVVAQFSLFLGAGIRCLAMLRPIRTWILHVGQAVAALAGPLLFASPPVISATWFPVQEQTLAVSVCVMAGTIGQAISFVLGPLFVNDNPTCQQNETGVVTTSPTIDDLTNITGHNCSYDKTFVQEAEDGILKLLLSEFAWSGVILLVILLYFPGRPPSPPSVSASKTREDFKTGFLQLIKSPAVWAICIIYGLPQAVFSMWLNFVDVLVRPLGIGQNDAGWMGFGGVIAACVTCVAAGSFIDHFKKWLKLTVIVMFVMAILYTGWFILMCQQIIPSTKVWLYVSYILVGGIASAPQALLIELVCQVCYPIGEGIACGALTIVFNIFAVLFLIVTMIPSLGTAWVNWSILGSVAICIPPLILVPVQFKRLHIDQQTAIQTGT